VRISSAELSFGRRGPLISLGLFVFAIVAAYEVSQYIINGDTFSLLLIGVAAVGCSLVVAILNDWRNGLYIFFAWLLFEDLVRKYLGNNMLIYFGKDLLVAVVYVSYLAAIRRKELRTFRPPFLMPLVVFIWFGVIQAFNPASTSLVFSVLGLKLYFYYVPLLFIGYSLLNSEAELRRFFLVNLGLAAVIAALGIAQAILGSTFLNPAQPAADIKNLSTLYRLAPLSGTIVYRPTSVFVSDGRFASYMLLAWILAFGFSGYLLLRSRRGRNLVFLTLAIVSAGVVFSGSRGALLYTGASLLICSAAFFWGAPWRQGEALRGVRTLQRTLLVGGLAFLLFLVAFPEALSSRFSFYSETLSLDSPDSELVHRVRDYPLQNFLLAFQYPRWPYGYGIGTASLGLQYVARILKVKSTISGVENGYGTLVVELGILGLILWIVWTLSLVLASWKIVKSLRGSPWFPLAVSISWFAVLLLFPLTFGGISPYQNFVLNAYLWLLVGILFRLPHIVLSRQPAGAGQSQSRTL
jgi:hypothetical protein